LYIRIIAQADAIDTLVYRGLRLLDTQAAVVALQNKEVGGVNGHDSADTDVASLAGGGEIIRRVRGEVVQDRATFELIDISRTWRVCENIKFQRNKRIGHTDIKRAEDPTFKWLPAVTLEEVDGALGVLRRMMQGLILALLDRDYDYDPDLPLGRDGNRLLYLLRKAHELQLHTPRTEGVV